MPATTFSYLGYSYSFLNAAKPCGGNLQPSTVVGDTTNSFCIDPTHIAPLSDPTYGYFADLKNGTLPSFAFIESGSGLNDEHPGYQQSVLAGQFKVASIINALMRAPRGRIPSSSSAMTRAVARTITSRRFLATPTTGPTMRRCWPELIHRHIERRGEAGHLQAMSTPTNPDGSPGPATTHCDLKPSAPGTYPETHDRLGQRFCCPAWLPHSEHGDLTVREEALRFAHSDGPHSHHQVRRESLYRQ